MFKYYKKFIVETTCKERFEIEKKGSIYYWKDIDPPILEKNIVDFKSFKIVPKEIYKTNPNYEYRKTENIGMFDGIKKGLNFAFSENLSEGYTVSRGKIDRFYSKNIIGNQIFNIHLFVPPGKKVVDIYSLFSINKAIKGMDIMMADIIEFDVSEDYLVFNRPFIIVRYDDVEEKILLTHIYDRVTGIIANI